MLALILITLIIIAVMIAFFGMSMCSDLISIKCNTDELVRRRLWRPTGKVTNNPTRVTSPECPRCKYKHYGATSV